MVAVAHPDPTATLEVRPLRRRHLRAVLRIEGRVYPRPWTLGLFLSELGQHTSRIYLGGWVGGRLVAYAGLMLAVDDGHVTTIAVDPAWQGARVGTRMLLALARAGIDRGCRSLTLEVRVSNTVAQRLYRRFGFAPAGIRKGYYPETGEDALVMWAHDVDTDAYRRRLEAIEASVPGPLVVADR